ncbi:MAG: hypothetical protein ACO4CS_16820 [bacterium]
MGLDITLYASKQVENINLVLGAFPVKKKVIEIDYWRKNNDILNWIDPDPMNPIYAIDRQDLENFIDLFETISGPNLRKALDLPPEWEIYFYVSF